MAAITLSQYRQMAGARRAGSNQAGVGMREPCRVAEGVAWCFRLLPGNCPVLPEVLLPLPKQAAAAMRIIRASSHIWIVTGHAGKVSTGGS